MATTWKLAFALLLLGASPGPTIIQPTNAQLVGEALIVPADSPVRFKRWDKYGYAVFDGRFELTGAFTYGCAVDCEGPVTEEDIRTDFIPDPATASRLPHWKLRNNDISLVLSNDKGFANAVADRKLHAAIRAGRVPYIEGRATIIVEDFRTGIECDSANYEARFVRMAGAPEVKPVKLEGDYGCL
jgi:hypothetical protein